MSGTSVQNVAFGRDGRELHGYLQVPPTGSGPAVIVIQEWWGLTTHIADVTRRLAAEGFVALAPDLYGGATTHDPAEAMELLKALPVEQTVKDLSGSIDYLLSLPEVTSRTVGLIGFCMGGGFVLRLAAEAGDKVSAAVPFYGLAPDAESLRSTSAAIQGHFGRDDASIPLETVAELFTALQSSDIDAEYYVYPAGHAFLNDENLIGTYDPVSAGEAWSRAVTFLKDRVS